MTTITGVYGKVIAGMAGIAGGVMVFVETEISGMVKGGGNPFNGTVAFVTIIRDRTVISVAGFLVTGCTVVFADALYQSMIEGRSGLPARCCMTMAATCRHLCMKGVGRLLVTAVTIINHCGGK